MQLWQESYRADPRGAALADRHYSRQKVGAKQFVPPGRCVVLLAEAADAVWVTSWPYAEYVKHDWGGAWICSLFRNESRTLSSQLILSAIVATRNVWPNVPDLGMITFIDEVKTQRRRSKRHLPGHCYRMAGFIQPPCPDCDGGRVYVPFADELGVCGRCRGDGLAYTKSDRRTVLQLLPSMMP